MTTRTNAKTSLIPMILPLLRDEAFMTDVASVRSAQDPLVSPSQVHVWWLGQSGFLIHHQGSFLLLDPYLSDSLTRKYADTDKPHVRISERVIDPARLDFVNVVTSSHAHTDHLDPETLQPLATVNPGLRIVCPEAIRSLVADRSGLPADRIIGLDSGVVPSRLLTRQPPFRIHAVPAAHEKLERDSFGHLTCLGYVIQVGTFRIYHSGDTVRFPGMAEMLRPFRIDLAILPINGRAPERRVAGNLDGTEAAQLAHDIDAGVVVPCHYDMFEFNTASTYDFVSACWRLSQPHRVLQLGERLMLDVDPGA